MHFCTCKLDIAHVNEMGVYVQTRYTSQTVLNGMAVYVQTRYTSQTVLNEMAVYVQTRYTIQTVLNGMAVYVQTRYTILPVLKHNQNTPLYTVRTKQVQFLQPRDRLLRAILQKD